MTERRLARERTRSAAQWFAVMRGPGADAERAAFEAWRMDVANAEAYARAEATWNDSRFLANRPVGRDRDLSRARRKVPPAALLAAGIALLTLLSASLIAQQLGWLAAPTAPQRATTSIAAATPIAAGATVRTIQLADGSRVTLDRHAAFRDLSTARERRFVLVRGRARFDVVHDAARPFLVDTDESRVVAHGTLFDVGIEDHTVRVTLIEGSVEVRGQGSKARGQGAGRFLAPGEELLVRAGSVGAPSRAAVTNLAWAEPMISFDAAPLAEAIAAFNRGSDRAVRLQGEGFAAMHVSGAFRRDDPRGFADALAASFGLTVEPAKDGSLLLHADAPGAPTRRDAGER